MMSNDDDDEYSMEPWIGIDHAMRQYAETEDGVE